MLKARKGEADDMFNFESKQDRWRRKILEVLRKNKQNSPKKSLRFKMTDEALRKRIIEVVKPIKSDYFSYQNLNLLYGVYDEEKDMFLTLSYYLSEAIARTGGRDEYRYVVITKDEGFIYPNAMIDGSYSVSRADISAAIRLYTNIKEILTFERQMEANLKVSFNDLKQELRERIFD